VAGFRLKKEEPETTFSGLPFNARAEWSCFHPAHCGGTGNIEKKEKHYETEL
jgi:hypothetical protein